MVFADVDENAVHAKNVYPESKLENYYKDETVYTLYFYDFTLKRIKEYFNRDAGKIRILDFGGGSGIFMRRAQAQGFDIIGVDYSPYAKKAAKLFNLKLLNTMLTPDLFEKESFEVVFSHATYEHLNDPGNITEMLAPFLKKDGLFIITGVPNYNTATIHLFRNFWRNMPPGHVNFWTKSSLNNLARKFKFEVKVNRTYGYNVWYIQEKLNSIKKLLESENVVIPDKNPLYVNSENLELTFLQKIISRIYFDFSVPRVGQSVEFWGIKK